MRAVRRLAAVGVVGACLVAIPAVAQAKIVPGSKVAGVALGDSAAKVKATLGTPEPGSNILNYRYLKRHGLGVYFVAGKALDITVVGKKQRTASGIGVGSTRAALEKAYPKAKCRPALVGTNAFECRLPGRFAGRRTETVFVTKKDRVATITVRFA
ncbi:MAG TPA: hypothetical protein PKE32_08760 [Miltoncostaeaceae bacterium]|nr:hypothetical protein [Miltoncostaeaceae bacterium]